jgi:hypothetical protein
LWCSFAAALRHYHYHFIISAAIGDYAVCRFGEGTSKTGRFIAESAEPEFHFDPESRPSQSQRGRSEISESGHNPR